MSLLLGLDPGLQCTGYGCVRAEGRQFVLVEAGTFRSRADQPLESRLAALHADLCEVIAECRPTAVAMEDLFTHVKHPRTAVVMGHARGVLMLAAAQAVLTITPYPATRVKVALTGSGRAGKEQVARSVCHLLGLEEAPRPFDVTDALAVAICHGLSEAAGTAASRYELRPPTA